jgi:hypothetical protein
MANSENPAMKAVQTASAQTSLPGALANAGPCQLLGRNHAVLVGREPGDRAVGTPIATFRTHVGALSDDPPNLPPSSPVFAPHYPNVNA